MTRRDHRHDRVPPAGTEVAAFGDSLMWGQGLDRIHPDRFSELITAQLPAILGGPPAVVVHDLSRSGAQIRARADQPKKFVDTFPALFANAAQRKAFLDGREGNAHGLYGENPAPFPTVLAQVDLLPDAKGKAVDVALVDGGINDIDVEDIVSPTKSPGEFIERWDGKIRQVGHDDVLELLGRVRRKCPNAVIMYFGFFAPLSYVSNTGKLRDLFEYETDDAIGWFLNGIFGCEDVNAAILAAQTRATWLQGRWQYWTRQAVVDANRDDAVRGKGVLFIPSGFGPDNAGFANAPFIFDDYRDPTVDPAQAVRRRRIPRIDHLDEMQKLYDLGTSVGGPFTVLPPAGGVRKLEAALDGSTSLKAAMRAYAADPGPKSLAQMLLPLRDDILRMRHALIASTGHPNQQGARSYANNAIRRLREHRALVHKLDIEQRPGQPPPLPGGAETLDAKLRRYKLRGLGTVRADIGHLDVDSLALRAVTSMESDQNFFADVWLVVTTTDGGGTKATRQYLLNFVYRTIPAGPMRWVVKPYPHFEPGATNRFTVDTMGTLRLDEITGCAVVVGGDRLAGLVPLKAYGKVWRPDVVRLEVNGHQVAEVATAGRQLGFFSSLDLSWPAAQPNVAPPKLASVTVTPVKQLPPRVHARRALAPAAVLDRPTAPAATVVH